MVRSFLRSLGILRKPEGDEQHEPLLPYVQRSPVPSGYSEDDRAHGDLLALHGTQSRAKRAWLFFDVLGNPTLKEVRGLQILIASYLLHLMTCRSKLCMPQDIACSKGGICF